MTSNGRSIWLAWLRPPRAVVVLTGVVVTSFLASIVYAGHIASAIDGMAYDIGENAAPSVRYLSAARTQLFTMVGALSGAFVDPTRIGSLRATIEQAHARLHQKLDAYVELPFFPGEHDGYQSTRDAVDDAERAVQHVVDRLEQGDLIGAQSVRDAEMAPAVDRADADLEAAVTFDAEQGTRLGLSIQRLRRKAQRTLWVLGLLDVALAVSLMEIARRVSRQHLALRDRQQEAEREMSRKLGATIQATSVHVAQEELRIRAARGRRPGHHRSGARGPARRPCGARARYRSRLPFNVWVFSGMERHLLQTVGWPPTGRSSGGRGPLPRRSDSKCRGQRRQPLSCARARGGDVFRAGRAGGGAPRFFRLRQWPCKMRS